MRLLILSSSTGGGHDMRARSLTQWVERCHASQPTQKPWEVERYQVLEDTHGLYRFGVDLYNGIQRLMPRLHHLYFNYLEVAAMHRRASSILGRTRFMARLQDLRPDVIVSTHAHLNHGYFALAREALGPRVRCVTYCGELFGGYGFSRHWVNPEADLFIGAVEETCQEARRLGMPAARCVCGGFLLNPVFWEPPLDAQERERFIVETLHLNPAEFVLLLSTGANGANNHLGFLEALRRAGLRPQVVALCGDDLQAYEAVDRWGSRHQEFPVRALRKTDRMRVLMESASAIVARPGTGTTSEAIQTGCPILFNGAGGVMPQEAITLRFAKAHGFCHRIGRAADLPEVLRPWLMERARLQEVRARLRMACPQLSPEGIVRLLGTLIHAKL